MFRLIYGIAIALFIVALAGCGGSVGNISVTSTGSGQSTATNTPNQPNTLEPQPVTVTTNK
jgi:hypothetical protein